MDASTNNYQYSSAQIDDLWDIANMCAVEGGPAVFRARSTLRFTLDSMILWQDNCPSPPSGSRISSSDDGDGKERTLSMDKVEKPKEASFSVHPNPAVEQFEVQYDLRNESRGALTLMSLTGEKVQKVRLQGENGTVKFKVGKEEEGVYLLLLKKENGETAHVKRITLMK